MGTINHQAPEQSSSVPPGGTLDVSIVIPTYKEVDNLALLIPEVTSVLTREQLRGELLIVDDNSQDGTQSLCDQLCQIHPVRLLVRHNERGLSGAVLHGLRHAQGRILIVMDGDMSHPPEAIPQLFAAIDGSQADFAIGSRYVPGGGTDEHWGWYRRLNSQLATLLARPLSRAKDPLAGYFALSRGTFARAQALDPIGYKIGLELMVKAGCRRIHEVPIVFRNRAKGESKLSFKEQLNYLRHLGRLYAHRLLRAHRALTTSTSPHASDPQT